MKVNTWQKDYSSNSNSVQTVDTNNSLVKILNLVEENKRVLEFGCATGYFSQLLVEKGCRVTGIEINSEAARVAEQYCEKVIVADLDFVSLDEILEGQSFDIAIFGDVLEHLREPWKVLRQLQSFLNSSGFVVASIPNIAHGSVRLALLSGEFDYQDLGILDNTHLRFFTRKTVQSLFEESGYVIDLIDRTKIPVFSNENVLPRIDRKGFNSSILKKIKLDPESDTLQFILRAYPSTEKNKDLLLIDRVGENFNNKSFEIYKKKFFGKVFNLFF